MFVNDIVYMCFINRKYAAAAARRFKKLHFKFIHLRKVDYIFCPRCRKYLYGRFYVINGIR